MKNLRYPTVITIIVVVIIFAILIYSGFRKASAPDEVVNIVDLPQIFERDTLIAVTATNNTDYFIYRGTPMGFQLELLESFAKALDVNLRVIVENDINAAGEYLLNGLCDILAISLPMSKEKELLYSFSEPVVQASLVLVQRMPDFWWTIPQRQLEDSLIRSHHALAEKKIYLHKGSTAIDRIKKLSDEIARDIFIIEIDSIDCEQIIRYVSEGVFDYTIANENMARFNQQIYKNLDVETQISFPQNLSWAVRKESVLLLDSLNNWLTNFKSGRDYRTLLNRYFFRPGRPPHTHSIFYSGTTGVISEYDKYIKKYSEIINWDWRLLASLIYQESKFNPEAVSWAGAFGIMQLMPATAEELGIDSSSSVAEHIHAGVRYLAYLNRQFDEEITDSITRIKLILAGYNIGFGHVHDAIRLAEYYDKDSDNWLHIKYYLSNLTNPKYFNNEVVRNGYFPGYHAVVFADEIVERYMHYKNIIPDN